MQEVNLYRLLQFYVKKWYVILAFTLIGLGAGFVYSNYVQVPLYKSDATLILIDNETGQTPKDATLINNYLELFKSRKVLEPVIGKLKLNIPHSELVNSIEVSNQKSTEVIKVSIVTKNGKNSSRIADEAINSFKAEVHRLYGKDNIQVLDRASKPTSPYNVQTMQQVAIATAAGLLVSMIILFFAYDFSSTRKTLKEEIAEEKKRVTKEKAKLAARKKAVTAIVQEAKALAEPLEEKERPEEVSEVVKSISISEQKKRSMARKAMRALVRLTIGDPTRKPKKRKKKRSKKPRKK